MNEQILTIKRQGTSDINLACAFACQLAYKTYIDHKLNPNDIVLELLLVSDSSDFAITLTSKSINHFIKNDYIDNLNKIINSWCLLQDRLLSLSFTIGGEIKIFTSLTNVFDDASTFITGPIEEVINAQNMQEFSFWFSTSFKKTLSYKGYLGSIEYNEKSKTWNGKLINYCEPLDYSADTEEELETVFKELISDLIGEWEVNGETFYKSW